MILLKGLFVLSIGLSLVSAQAPAAPAAPAANEVSAPAPPDSVVGMPRLIEFDAGKIFKKISLLKILEGFDLKKFGDLLKLDALVKPGFFKKGIFLLGAPLDGEASEILYIVGEPLDDDSEEKDEQDLTPSAGSGQHKPGMANFYPGTPGGGFAGAYPYANRYSQSYYPNRYDTFETEGRQASELSPKILKDLGTTLRSEVGKIKRASAPYPESSVVWYTFDENDQLKPIAPFNLDDYVMRSAPPAPMSFADTVGAPPRAPSVRVFDLMQDAHGNVHPMMQREFEDSLSGYKNVKGKKFDKALLEEVMRKDPVGMKVYHLTKNPQVITKDIIDKARAWNDQDSAEESDEDAMTMMRKMGRTKFSKVELEPLESVKRQIMQPMMAEEDPRMAGYRAGNEEADTQQAMMYPSPMMMQQGYRAFADPNQQMRQWATQQIQEPQQWQAQPQQGGQAMEDPRQQQMARQWADQQQQQQQMQMQQPQMQQQQRAMSFADMVQQQRQMYEQQQQEQQQQQPMMMTPDPSAMMRAMQGDEMQVNPGKAATDNEDEERAAGDSESEEEENDQPEHQRTFGHRRKIHVHHHFHQPQYVYSRYPSHYYRPSYANYGYSPYVGARAPASAPTLRAMDGTGADIQELTSDHELSDDRTFSLANDYETAGLGGPAPLNLFVSSPDPAQDDSTESEESFQSPSPSPLYQLTPLEQDDEGIVGMAQPLDSEENPDQQEEVSFAYLPQTLQPFLGVLSVDHPDDPWITHRHHGHRDGYAHRTKRDLGTFQGANGEMFKNLFSWMSKSDAGVTCPCQLRKALQKAASDSGVE